MKVEEGKTIESRAANDFGRHWPDAYKEEVNTNAANGSLDATHSTENDGRRLPPMPSRKIVSKVGDLIYGTDTAQ
ncbi:MAG: hypothetical protein HQL53_00685 [Magnetococcales bacterium]|nr:hypothetical protein [Magnetococcales bacterium]